MIATNQASKARFTWLQRQLMKKHQTCTDLHGVWNLN